MPPPSTPDATPRATTSLTGAAAQDLRELFAAPERVGAALRPQDVARALELVQALAQAPRAALVLAGRAPDGDPALAGAGNEPGVVDLPGVGRALVAPVLVPLAQDGTGPARKAGVAVAGPLAAGAAPDPAVVGRHVGTLLLERALARRAAVDRVTGLLARPAFERGLPELARRVEAGEKLALLLVDIDGLRDLNAARGWTAGDDALGTLGAAALAEVADPAHAARWGGDEVVLVLTGKSASAAGANAVADRLREALGAGLGSVAPTLGAGVALAPDHAADVERLLALADQALAHAKRGGPGRTAVWEASLKGLRGRDRVAGVLTGSPARDYRSVQAILDTVAAEARLAPLEETLVALVDRVLDVTGAERGLVLLRRSGAWTVEVARRRGGRTADDRAFAASVCDDAVREGHAIQRLAETEQPISPSADRAGLQAVLCAPLGGEDVPEGALYVDTRDPGRFDAAAVAFFDALTAACITALRNASLYGRLVERADRLASDVDSRDQALVAARRRWERLRRRPRGEETGYAGLVGDAPSMRELFAMLRSLEGTAVPVVIEGESGTGKELVARAIHVRSPRKDGPLVAVNCGAIPAGLVESELFGHAKGAFTGAHADRRGLMEAANGGTLFLDELGELPLDAQAKLLRALQENEVRRVGEDRPRAIDVRVVAATNRDLREAIAGGEFREDLFYRLAVFRLRLPPLRERPQDIPLLARHLLMALGKPDAVLDAATSDALVRRKWPGNVRELKNALERALALAGAGPIRSDHLSEGDSPGAGGLDNSWFERPLPDARALFTYEYAKRAIARANGSVPGAARSSGVSRQTLYRAMTDGERILGGGAAEPESDGPAA
jgi:diguanylate cyclase (GGDEF)-like protein